jgi:hypothetical protein
MGAPERGRPDIYEEAMMPENQFESDNEKEKSIAEKYGQVVVEETYTDVSQLIDKGMGQLVPDTSLDLPIYMFPAPNKLGPNEYLDAGRHLKSENGKYYALMQADGNLVLGRTSDGRPLWASGTEGKGAVRAIMQSDGNFVLYTGSKAPVWATNTVKKSPGLTPGLAMQNDGNLVVHHSGKPVWATGTAEAQRAAAEMRRLHVRLGGERGPLGPALSDISQDGEMQVRSYQGGTITWTSHAGAEAYAQYFTRIIYKGLHCFGETSGLGSDEPYAIVSAYNPTIRERVRTIKFGPYENVESGTTLPEILDIYSEVASDIVIHTVVMEHDSGDHDRVRAAIQDALKKAADAAAAAFGVPMPPNWIDGITFGVAEAFTSIFGLGDDVIGQDFFLIRREELIDQAHQAVIPLKKFGPIEFNYPLDDADRLPISDGDASYKVYFEVVSGRYDAPPRITVG